MKKLKLGNLDKPIPVILHGFGSVLGQIIVGKVVNLSKRNVTVLVKDDDEEYRETYSRKDGIRLQDKGEDSGWQIQLDDLVPKPDLIEDRDALTTSLDRIKLLHKEKHPVNDEENLVVEVWFDSEVEEKYAKFYRQDKDGGRQRCFFIPFNLIKRVLADHEVTWEIDE